MRLISPIVVLLVFIVTGCAKKTTTAVDDKSEPAINILQPTNGQVFIAGQTVSISASVTDNVKISQTEVHVINETKGALIRDIHSYPNNASTTMQDAFVAEAATVYTIKFIAKDPSQNIAEKEITITVN